jgi:hypothetical protein
MTTPLTLRSVGLRAGHETFMHKVVESTAYPYFDQYQRIVNAIRVHSGKIWSAFFFDLVGLQNYLL